MKPKIYNQKGFYHTLITSILIITVALLTQFRKDLFVYETGNIGIFGSIGMVLAIGLLFKWRKVREVLAVFSGVNFLILASIAILWDEKFRISYALLSLVVAAITWLLQSSQVKHFTSNTADNTSPSHSPLDQIFKS